jgi:tRNA(Ile)-lysidine synthase
MLDRLHKYNTENGLFRQEDKLLVTVSGGVDSVALCHLLRAYKARFVIAHCNFGLRGKESDEDELFVEELAEEMEVNIHIKKFDTKAYAKDSGLSTQMAARELRYQWFSELAEQKEYRYIVTAHHQNDLVETVLLNLIRGTGIAGLHGIKAKSGNILRPLLFASKEDILQYARENKLQWREDSSNESNKYQRNLLRLDVIPLLKKINPNLENTFLQSVEKISAAENIFNNYIEGCKIDFLSQKENYTVLEYDFLKEETEPRLILFELLRPFGFNYSQAAEIVESLDGDPGKKFISSSHLLVKDRSQLIITKKKEETKSAEISIEENTETVFLPWTEETIKFQLTTGFEKIQDTCIAFLDFEKLTFPLLARPWQAGDSFHPFGMKGKKKVSDFLNDLKVPLNLKENITVLLSGNDIVWVAGYRIDERYKASEDKKSLSLFVS